jgi:hypothetical protein
MIPRTNSRQLDDTVPTQEAARKIRRKRPLTEKALGL